MVRDLPSEDIRAIADSIVKTLLDQRKHRVERGFYWENQIAFAYNSERIEGSPLTKEQTRSIYETKTVGGLSVPIDAIQETSNHFRLFDFALDTLGVPLDKSLIQQMHAVLKTGTQDDLDNVNFNVGGWKLIPNGVGGIRTTPPDLVDREMGRLIEAYNSKAEKTYRDIVGFHTFFERIHPFQDGNGRVGRMIMFRECLVNGLTPFIVLDEEKSRYYDALGIFDEQPTVFINFAEDMADLYYAEFASLIPQHLLLPSYTEFLEKERDHAKEASSFFERGNDGAEKHLGVRQGVPNAQKEKKDDPRQAEA